MPLSISNPGVRRHAQERNDRGDDRRFEIGQMAQYRLLILQESGNSQAALDYLRAHKADFLDDRYCVEHEVCGNHSGLRSAKICLQLCISHAVPLDINASTSFPSRHVH